MPQDIYDESGVDDVVCAIFPLVFFVRDPSLVVQHANFCGTGLAENGRNGVLARVKRVRRVLVRSGHGLDLAHVQLSQRLALVVSIPRGKRSTIRQPQVYHLYIFQSLRFAEYHVAITDLDCARHPRLIVCVNTGHPRVRSVDAILEQAREISLDTTASGCEDDGGDTFVNVEIMEEIWVLVKEGVGWMGGEIDCATAVVSEAS